MPNLTPLLPPKVPRVNTALYVVERDVMVPMRDGVRLAADIYYPARDGARLEGKFPAILERTPYNKGGRFHGMPGYPWQPFYASRGYVCISQDVRGRFKSEGTWHMMIDDVADGFDTAQWLIEQPWSDGGFGMIGTSYVGGTQHAMALGNPPGLKTLVPVDAVVDAGYFGMRYGGAWELRFTNWIFSMAAPEGSRASRDPATREALEECARNIRGFIQKLPIRKGATPLHLAPEYEEWLVFAMSHGENDAYWKQPGLGLTHNIDAYKDVPVYLVGGWYDSWARQTTMSYAALSKNKRSPVRMILGPWIHGSHMMSMHGDTDFGASAALDGLEFRLRWFDRWLKGIHNGVENDAPVKIFVMGGGSEAMGPDGRHRHGGVWRDEYEWPLARTHFTPYCLHTDRTLSIEPPREANSSTTYEYDPQNPVPSIGGNISSAMEIMQQGAWDQKGGPHIWNCPNEIRLSSRPDVIVFMTPPLADDIEVTGPIEVKLWASSSAVDTDFTAKLLDVHPPTADYPEGIEMNLEDGIIRARFRGSLEHAEQMNPGEIYQFIIQLYPTSNLFKAGHRIRLDISSSNFPRFDPNPNTGEPLNEHTHTIVAHNTIYHDAAHPSHALLPIIPLR